jgi:hypothetical protein
MRLLGERNWYLPRWLTWLPNIHIEGARPAAVAPAALVRQYAGDGMVANTAAPVADGTPPVAAASPSARREQP